MTTTARAHPNIALIKYWGKQPVTGNLPVAPSLSITLDELATTTTVGPAAGPEDELSLDGETVSDPKIERCLANLRARFDLPPMTVVTANNFPTAAGLASSASGFAALITAVDAEFRLGMRPSLRSDLARQASGSAARSIFGGFVGLTGPDWVAKPLLDPADWPLKVVIAVTDTRRKAISSTDGMMRSAASPFFEGWVTSTSRDYDLAKQAVAGRDFAALAALAESSCLKMHGLMLSTPPGLIYWNPATLACVHAIRALREEDGVPAFFTIDAGPQVKVVCEAGAVETVRRTVESVTGVRRVFSVGLGGAAIASHAS